MKLYKKADRKLNVANMLKAFKDCGFRSKHIGEWDKWKDLYDGGRLQVKIDVYEIKNEDVTSYMIGDTLGRVAAPLVSDKEEVMDWLKEHGYKRDKQWYMEDYGMDESTWNYWNGLGER